MPPMDMLNKYCPSSLGTKLARHPSAVGIMCAFTFFPLGLVIAIDIWSLVAPEEAVITRNCRREFTRATGHKPRNTAKGEIDRQVIQVIHITSSQSQQLNITH